MQLLRGWKLDEIEDKLSSTEKRNSYSSKIMSGVTEVLCYGTAVVMKATSS